MGLVFSRKGLENSQKKHIFSKKADFFKKSNFEDFRGFASPFRKKTKSPMKQISGQEILKIIKKIHFLYLKVDKTTSR